MLVHVAFLLALAIAAPAGAQAYKAPRTPSGAPDLGGDWSSYSFTRLVRPPRFTSLTITDAEAAAFLQEERNRLVGIKPPKKPDAPAEPEGSDVGDVQSEWYELDGVGLARMDGQLRTSWIVDPITGRLPYNSVGLARAENAFRGDEEDCAAPNSATPTSAAWLRLRQRGGPADAEHL